MVWTTNGRRYIAACLNIQSIPGLNTSTKSTGQGVLEFVNIEGTTGYWFSSFDNYVSSSQSHILSMGVLSSSSASFLCGNSTESNIPGNDYTVGTNSCLLLPKIGIGTSTPSVNDYSLTLPANCVYNVTRDMRSSQDDYSLSYTLSITNNDSSSVSITEIGLVKSGCNSTSTTSANLPVTTLQGTAVISYTNLKNAGAILLTRDLLSTPLVIPAGETRSLTYRIDFSDIFS